MIISTLVAIFIVFMINQSPKHTTFGKAMSEMLDGEPVHKIMMSDTKGEKVFDVSDSEGIKSLLEEHSSIALEKSDGVGEELSYNLSVYNEEYKVYAVQVNQNTIRIGGNYYSVKGENSFYLAVDEIYKQQN